MNKLEIFMFVFSILLKVSGIHEVNLAVQQQRDGVCKFFTFLSFILLGIALLPYVQAAF